MAYSAERVLSENAENLPPDLKAEADGKLAALRTAIAANNVPQMQTAMNDLNDALQRVGQAAYAQQAGAGAGPTGPGGGPGGSAPGGSAGNAGDDTVEGSSGRSSRC